MKIRKSQFVFYACISIIIGVALATFFVVDWKVIFIIGVASIVTLIFSKAKSIIMLLVLCLLFFILGIARYQLSIPAFNENHLAFYNNSSDLEFSERQQTTFQGIIIDEPDIRKDHVKYKVQAIDYKGKVLIRTSLFPKYKYGDILEINCELTEPEPIEDFRYDKYLALSGIYSICYRGQIKLIDSNQGNLFKAIIFKIKSKVVETASLILPEPQSSFLGGLLWGAKRGMPEDVLENFNKTGVTHIIAVSGYNITIIAVMLTNLFIGLGLSRKKAFWLIVLGIVFFVIITGSPASIVRAGIMGIIVLISTTMGRATKMHNTLVIVCVIMLMFNPKILIWDAGFQLSFLATIGLIYLSPKLERFTKWMPQIFQLRESFNSTMSAIIVTAPLIIFQFGRFSLLAPITNLLILPIIPINMAVGFIVVVLGLIWLPLGQIFGYVSWVILTYVLILTEILAKIEWLQF